MLWVGFKPQWRHTVPVRHHSAKLQDMPGLNPSQWLSKETVGPFYTGGSKQLRATESGFQAVLPSKFHTSHSDKKKRGGGAKSGVGVENCGRKVFGTQEFKGSMTTVRLSKETSISKSGFIMLKSCTQSKFWPSNFPINCHYYQFTTGNQNNKQENSIKFINPDPKKYFHQSGIAWL